MANVSVTFPLVFDLDTNTTMAGEDIGAVDADCVINIGVSQNVFKLKFKQQDTGDTDEFNVEFIAPALSGESYSTGELVDGVVQTIGGTYSSDEIFNPFDDMKVTTATSLVIGGVVGGVQYTNEIAISSTTADGDAGTAVDDATGIAAFEARKATATWAYEPNQDPGTNNPTCLISKTWTNNLAAYPSRKGNTISIPQIIAGTETNLQSIIMQLIADHYFNHPLATAPIENDDSIAESINVVIDAMKTAWDLSGNTQTADNSTPASILNRNTLLAKRAVIEQFIGDVATNADSAIGNVTGSSPERFTRLMADNDNSNNGVTTFEFISGDSIEFLIYFTNTVGHTVSSSDLLNNTGKFDDTIGTASTGIFSNFSKKVKLIFTMD